MFLTLLYMKTQHDSRQRRTALVAVVATVAVWGSFGASVHADDEPVADPPVGTGEIDGAIVAVAAPPVPPAPVVVAVGQPPVPPPVPPAPVVVAVGQPPVPPNVPPAPVMVAVGQPPVPPTPVPAPIEVAVGQPPVPPTALVQPQAAVVVRSPAIVERISDAIVDVAALVQAGLTLIDSRL